ncbi:MAG: hypothetical protein IKB08_06080 [Clostridia bacterium]|nr:hypothetical protein [Clostridia bacterium]
MKILKAILLISAFLAVVLRLLAYENAEFLGESAQLYNIIAVVSAAVCLITAIIWALIIKKQEKGLKDDEDQE